MVLLVRHPPNRTPERAYAFRVVLSEFLGLSYTAITEDRSNIEVSLQDTPGAALVIDDGLFGIPESDWLTERSLPSNIPHVRVPPEFQDAAGRIGETLPLLFAKHNSSPLVTRCESGMHLHADLFGGVFFALTRYEEVFGGPRDAKDRFVAAGSIAHREGFLERAIVNEYVELLWQLLTALWSRLTRTQRSYRLLVSHDVDAVSVMELAPLELGRSIGADLLRRREPLLALRRAAAWSAGRLRGAPMDFDPYITGSFLMSQSEAVGVRSVFNFVANGADPFFDPRYDVGQPAVRTMIREIAGRGHEIGFHGSYRTYLDERRTAAELDRLKAVCADERVIQGAWGGRQHYLRWRNPTTWRNWEACGLAYDSTIGFADHIGFRAGTCWEYPVFDLDARKELKLRERPLIAMESSLLSYMGASLTYTAERMLQLSATCRRHAGDFTLLWHGHMLAGAEAQNTYAAVVKAAS